MENQSVVQNQSNLEEIKEVCLQKGVSGRIIEVLKRYLDKDILKTIIGSIIIPNFDVYKMAEVNQTAPRVLEALFGDTYNSVDFSDMKEVIQEICVHIAEKKDFGDFVLSVGMGGSIETPNIRMPSYILPAIRSLEKFFELKEAGKIHGCPQLKVFKANNIASYVNGFDSKRVSRVSELSFNLLRDFIERFYPQLKDFIVFTEDKPISEFQKNYFNNQVKLLKTSELIEEDLQNVTKMGEKHGQLEDGVNNALFYAVAHPYYNQSIINSSIKPMKNDYLPSVIVDYGGRPQVRFNKISRELIKLIKNNKMEDIIIPTVYVIIKPGKIPVYYTARDGDLPLGQPILSIDYNKIDKATHADYKEIFSYVNEQEFIDFINQFNQEHKELINSLG